MPDFAAIPAFPAPGALAGSRSNLVRELPAGGVVVSVARPACPFQALVRTRRPDLDIIAFAHPDIILRTGDTDMKPAEILAAAGSAAGCLIGSKPSRFFDRIAGIGPLKGREVAFPIETIDRKLGHLVRCDLLHIADCVDPVAMLESARMLLRTADRVFVEYHSDHLDGASDCQRRVATLLSACGFTLIGEAGDPVEAVGRRDAQVLAARRGAPVQAGSAPPSPRRRWSDGQDAPALPATGAYPPDGLGAHSFRRCGPFGRSVFGIWVPRPGRYRFTIRTIDRGIAHDVAFRCFIGSVLKQCRRLIEQDSLTLEATFDIAPAAFEGYVELGLLIPDGALRHLDGQKVGPAVHRIEVAGIASRMRVIG